MKWTDITSYSKSDPIPHVPRSWQLRLTPDIAVSVVSEHIYHKGEWVMHCRPWFDTHPLDMTTSTPAEKAQARALHLVRSKVAELSAVMSKCK